MKHIFRNWKTTVGGLLAAAGTAHAFGKFSDVAQALGLLLLGSSAKDGDITGLGH